MDFAVRKSCRPLLFNALYLFLLPSLGWSQQQALPSPGQLKKLSVEELMDIEVTLVGRTPQKLSEVASAIQVITDVDIRRSGATNIPEALRLLSNLQVAQLNASTWIISARGFNTIFANKLLVMIDGRTIYTPFFGGVIWEMHHVLLEDVERIEVVSGPGGTLWGANAVNGVINIITKHTRDTQGAYASVSVGSFLKNIVNLRYGGKLSKKVDYRLYGLRVDRYPTKLPTGDDNQDAWGIAQGGFRMDWTASSTDQLSLQGDLYGGTQKTAGSNSDMNGQHLLARWIHTLSDQSELMIQAYYDHYFRDSAPTQGSDRFTTYDLDVQHRFPVNSRHSILWGLGFRLAKDVSEYRTNVVGILPPTKNLNLYTGFIQDELTLHEHLKLTLGTKLLHNVYSKFEIQPSARLAWSIKAKNLLWGAVSRAVRTPSRLDVDYFLPTYSVPSNQPSVAGGPNFRSEKVTAIELGYRLQPTPRATLSVAGFYNLYHDVYSVEALPGTLTYQIQNGSEGESWGAEFSANYQLNSRWRIRGGYTYFNKNLRSKPGHSFDPRYLGNDAKNQALLQSILDLPANLQVDFVGRYLDYLPKTLATERVPGYLTVDARLAWYYKWITISVVGQSLKQRNHTEFNTLPIPRSLYANVSLRF